MSGTTHPAVAASSAAAWWELCSSCETLVKRESLIILQRKTFAMTLKQETQLFYFGVGGGEML